MIERFFQNQLILDENHLREVFSYLSMVRTIDIQCLDPTEISKLDVKLLELQLGKSDYYKVFNDIDFLSDFQNFIQWDFLSCDNRIAWDINKIMKFKDRLNFSLFVNETFEQCDYNFIQRCFINNGQPCGLSMSPYLNDEIISAFIDLWDWDCLSSNSHLNIDQDFIEKYFEEISFSGLAFNESLSYETLLYIRELQLCANLEYPYSIKIKGKERKYFNFGWDNAFEKVKIDWDKEKISPFLEILDDKRRFGTYIWQAFSMNIKRKELILEFQDKLDFFTLADKSHSIIWDIELTGILISKDIPLRISRYEVGLPDLLEKIKIEKSAILYYKDFWFKEYTLMVSVLTGDGFEKGYRDYPLWICFKENKNVIWDEDLQSVFE